MCTVVHATSKIRILIAKTYLILCLLYESVLFDNFDSSSKCKLNIPFNNIARYVYNLERYGHISVAAACLYGVTFDNLLNIRVLLFLHRIINKRIPIYLFDRNILVPGHRCLFSECQFYSTLENSSTSTWLVIQINSLLFVQFLCATFHDLSETTTIYYNCYYYLHSSVYTITIDRSLINL